MSDECKQPATTKKTTPTNGDTTKTKETTKVTTTNVPTTNVPGTDEGNKNI